MLYLNKISAQQASLDQLRAQKEALMAEREVLLDKHDKQMAANSDLSSKTAQLHTEIAHIE